MRRAWEFIEAAPSKGDVQRWIAAEVKPTANTRKCEFPHIACTYRETLADESDGFQL